MFIPVERLEAGQGTKGQKRTKVNKGDTELEGEREKKNAAEGSEEMKVGRETSQKEENRKKQ